MKIRKAVLPVAGVGTRFLPATIAVPKELLPIVDTPVLQILVEEAVEAGIEEIIFVVSAEKTAIREHFSPQPKLEKNLAEKNKTELLERIQKIAKLAKFRFVEQREPLGDGHAILQAREKVGDEPFLILFGDDLILSQPSATTQLIETWEQKNTNVLTLSEVPANEVKNYGIVALKSRTENLVEIASFVEKPLPDKAPSNLAIVGKYICSPTIFPILEKNLSSSGEIRLIDSLAELIKTESIFGEICKGRRYDTGNKFGLVKANIDFALKDPAIATATKNYLKKIVSDFKNN